MRPTFLGFESARRGLMVAQKGLDITGQNLMNIDTVGYTRQRVDQVAVSADTYRARYASPRSALAGQGVDINGISQTRDSFLDRRFREEYGEVRYHDQAASILSDLNSAIDEFTSDAGLSKAIQDIVDALGNSAAQADSKTFANLLSTTFKNMATMLHQFDSGLKKVASQQKYDLSVSVDSVNQMFDKLTSLNQEIVNDIAANKNNNEYYGPNELLDQRNLLLDELAQYCDLDVTSNANGSVTVKVNGHTAVAYGENTDHLRYEDNGDNTVSLRWNSSGDNADLTTGALKASVDYINGRGPNASSKNETLEKGILYYQDKLDAFAAAFAQKMNNVIPAAMDENGKPLPDEGYKFLVGALVPKKDDAGNVVEGSFVTSHTAAVTAENISVSDEWAKNASYIISQKGNLDSAYLQSMYTALKSDQVTFRTSGETFTGTFQEYLIDYNTGCFSEVSYHLDRFKATSTIADDLLDRRSSISGVSKQEEGSNMMMYQKSFEAVSRLMTAMDEALDVLINRTGLVGR